MALLLNEHQARAVADAMAALNNVGARIHVIITPTSKNQFLHVKEHVSGMVQVWPGNLLGDCGITGLCEDYRTQNDFIAAYGIE